jgi:hypothetical protein
MPKPSLWKRFLSFLDNVGRIQVILSLAFSGVVTTLLASLKGFLVTMPLGLRWGFFASLGVFLAALAILFLHWLAFRHDLPWLRGNAQPDPETIEQVDELSRQLAEAGTAKLALESERNQWTVERTATLKKLHEAEAGWKNGQENSTQLYQVQQYGEALPRLYTLDPAAHREAVSRAHELLPDLAAMTAGARRVWAHLAHLARQQGEASPIGQLVDRMEAAELGDFIRVSNSLAGQLQNGDDPRPFLVGTYTRYRRLRDALARLSAMTGYPANATPGYIEWNDAEKRFMYELSKKLAIPSLQAVRRAVWEYDHEHGPLKPVDPPHQG